MKDFYLFDLCSLKSLFLTGKVPETLSCEANFYKPGCCGDAQHMQWILWILWPTFINLVVLVTPNTCSARSGYCALAIFHWSFCLLTQAPVGHHLANRIQFTSFQPECTRLKWVNFVKSLRSGENTLQQQFVSATGKVFFKNVFFSPLMEK